MTSFAERAITFYSDLRISESLPEGVEVLNPYVDTQVLSVVSSYFSKFYNDEKQRIIILGINPGRFGAGITGITFTDPVKLEEDCEITNSFDKRPELSSRFVYELIHAFGGVRPFFSVFFLSAVSPLGFVRSGRNMNYYDERTLGISLKDFIVSTLNRQCNFGIRRDKAVCLGEGKNFKYLQKLNQEAGFFKKIIPLPHPRWVMQYRFKRREEYIRKYLDVLQSF